MAWMDKLIDSKRKNRTKQIKDSKQICDYFYWNQYSYPKDLREITGWLHCNPPEVKGG